MKSYGKLVSGLLITLICREIKQFTEISNMEKSIENNIEESYGKIDENDRKK